VIFRRRNKGKSGKAAAVAPPETRDPDANSLLADMDRLQAEAGGGGDPEALRRLMRLRHQAGVRLVSSGGRLPDYPSPSADLPVPEDGVLPAFRPGDLTPELLRAAILRDGCAIVRSMVDRDAAAGLGLELEQLFERRERGSPESDDEDLSYEEFLPDPPYKLVERGWVSGAGGIWLADSPRLMSSVVDLFEQARLRPLIAGYLGERPVMSVNKSTLRRARAGVSAVDWHQDGAFMGDVRTLNVWLTLSHCGESAPGLAMVPRRVEQIVATGTAGAGYDWSVSPALAEQTAGEVGTLTPIFEPGDAVLFDDYFLHATWVRPEMPNPRYAIESWFFSPSGFPREYVPLVF
jgi:hypothetical protein